VQASLSQLARTVVETARLTKLGQESESASQRALADSLDALARSRDLLARTSPMILG
jgi:hypothetical protein